MTEGQENLLKLFQVPRRDWTRTLAELDTLRRVYNSERTVLAEGRPFAPTGSPPRQNALPVNHIPF